MEKTDCDLREKGRGGNFAGEKGGEGKGIVVSVSLSHCLEKSEGFF